MFLAERITCANLESTLLSGAKRRPVWLEERMAIHKNKAGTWELVGHIRVLD